MLKFLRPFSLKLKAGPRHHISYPAISVNTFNPYLARLTKRTQNNAAAGFLNRIALVFNWQTTVDVYYAGVTATYLSANCNGFESVCLAMMPMEDETTQTAEQHIEFLSYNPDVFDESFDNVAALIVGSCSSNRSIAVKLRKSLIGCSSHRLNLPFVRSYLRKKMSSNEDIHSCPSSELRSSVPSFTSIHHFVLSPQ